MRDLLQQNLDHALLERVVPVIRARHQLQMRVQPRRLRRLDISAGQSREGVLVLFAGDRQDAGRRVDARDQVAVSTTPG